MLERIKNCICHPRFIGKYNKDKVGKIILIIFLFFALYLVVFGIRTFTENPFGEDADNVIISEVISEQNKVIAYDSSSHLLTGESFKIERETFGLYILPKEQIKANGFTVNIVLDSEEAFVYYGTVEVAGIKYKDIKTSSFTFTGISSNNVLDIYNFRLFIDAILECSYVFFQVYNFVEGLFSTLIMFMMLFLIEFIFARIINPTIEGKVRAKLVLYDCIIFLVCAMLASLFNQGWIAYVGYGLPIIYTTITFKHIVRVVIPKK